MDCRLCSNKSVNFDDHCEDHQTCYNCGSNDLNYSKRDVCEMIKQKTDCYINYNDFDYDKDNRDYEVSYDKLNSLGFDVTIDVEQGIDELIKVYEVLNFVDKRYFNTGFPEIN